MTKTKIFMGLGSLVLACSAFVASKPSKKFASFKTAFAVSGGAFSGVAVVGPTSSYFTNTVDANNITIKLATASLNVIETLYSTSAGLNTAYINIP